MTPPTGEPAPPAPTPMTGLERLRAGLASSGDRVPFADLVKMRVEDVQPGQITLSTDFPRWVDALLAASLPGPLAIAADGACGFAILTELPGGRFSVASQLRVDFVGPVSGAAGPWSCHAVSNHVTDDVGLSHGEVRNGAGDLVGLSTLWSAVLGVPPPPPKSAPTTVDGDPRGTDAGSDTAAATERSGPIAEAAGPLLDLPIFDELSISCLEATDGRTTLRVPPIADLANSVSSMHGGAIALIADLAGAIALASSDPSGSLGARRLWMQIDFLRPVRMTGCSEFRAAVSWRGKRMALVDGEVIGPAGTTSARIRQASLLRREA